MTCWTAHLLFSSSCSALSLRLFGVDITTAGRDAVQRKKSLPATPGFTTLVPVADEETNVENPLPPSEMDNAEYSKNST